jgi:transposase
MHGCHRWWGVRTSLMRRLMREAQVKGKVSLFYGSGAAARRYVEADHARADEYYLDADDAVAEYAVLDGLGEVTAARSLTADEYEVNRVVFDGGCIYPEGIPGIMPVPYPAEIRERAVRLVIEARQNPATRDGAITRIAKQLDLLPETVRKWVRRAEIDEGIRPGTTTDDAARITELEREVRELRRANQILKSASAFFAAELDRPSR